MPDVKYPKNPNSDTAFVEENGKRTRAIKVAVVDGTIDYPKNANSDSCYVTIDGKKQRALMVADVSGEGTVEYPNNPNSTKGYVEIDGKKQRVILTASLAGGGSTPTGTITITTNGEHDVTDYATADVQVPQPTGTITITGNGITDVTNYASADVQVPTTAPAYYIEKTVDANGNMTNGPATTMDFTGIKQISQTYAFAYAYYGDNNLSGQVVVGDKTDVSGLNVFQNMLYGCRNITGVKLSINSVSGATAFQNMLGGLKQKLTYVDIDDLVSVTATNVFCAFMDTPSTESDKTITVSINGLSEITQPLAPSYGVVFGTSCFRLESVSFGGLKAATFSGRQDQLQYLFGANTGRDAPNGCTIHFPSNFDPSDPNHTFDASTLTGYPTFGGNASYIHVAFDLPATE